MAEFRLNDLIEIMREAAGEAEDITLDETSAEVDFDELGYDSLALMATSNLVEKRFGVLVPEEELGQTRTLTEFVELVNRQLGNATVGQGAQ
jgi:act minimal PKS acyl carrier protein